MTLFLVLIIIAIAIKVIQILYLKPFFNQTRIKRATGFDPTDVIYHPRIKINNR